MHIPHILKLPTKIVTNGVAPTLGDDGYYSFTMPADRDFKLLQLTDLHIGCGILSKKADKLAVDAIINIVEKTRPDAIIITGDMVYPIPIHSGTINNMRATKTVCELFETFEIPWTVAFGNHDYEPFATHSKQAIADEYIKQPHCMFSSGVAGISGIGNYPITLKNTDGTINNILMVLDSNMYQTKSFFSGFDIIHEDQTEWYKSTIATYATADKPIPSSLAFFHIPTNEFDTAWKLLKSGDGSVTYHLGNIGEINDHIGTGYKLIAEDTFFEKMREFGSLKGIFCGHDHLNTISMTYKDIRLTYGMSIDYLAYKDIAKKYTQRGGTLINIDKNGQFSLELVPVTSINKIRIK